MPAVQRTSDGLIPIPVKMTYSHGEVVGFLGQDTVQLGWVSFRNQSFIIVEEEQLPRHRDWDGICGLGWRRMAAQATGQPLYRNFQPLYQAFRAGRVGSAKAALFAFVPGPEGHPHLWLGAMPMGLYKTDTLSWSDAEPLRPNEDRSFWVSRGHLEIRGAQPVMPPPLLGRFIVDTATPFVLAPRSVYSDLIRSLFQDGVFNRLCGVDPAAGHLVVCDCSVMQAVTGELWLNLGGRTFALDTPKLFKRVQTKTGAELCLLQIQQNSMVSEDPLDILGDLLSGPARDAAGVRTPLPSASAGPRPDLRGVAPEPEPKTAYVRKLGAASPPGVIDEMWVLGSVWLEHYVVILDFDNERIGFAEPLVLKNKTATAPQRITLSSDNGSSSHRPLFLGTFVFLNVVGVAVAGAVYIKRRLRRRKNFGGIPLGEEDDEEQHAVTGGYGSGDSLE
jgi:hypothetical protein